MYALVPNLIPATGSDQLTRIQVAWQNIKTRGDVRILTRENHPCLSAGAELLSRGIEVRVVVGRPLNTDELSFHIFGGDSFDDVLINHREEGRDHPRQLPGLSPAQVFQSHFDQMWTDAAPLESVLAAQVLVAPRWHDDLDQIATHMRIVRTKYRLDPTIMDAVIRHVAFRHSARVIFITGLPGSGKSVVRRRLAEKLSELRFQIDQQTDYLYAFRDFLHHAINLEDGRGTGFTADTGGAFHVRNEHDLEPALQSLSRKVSESRAGTHLTLAEFARSDLVSALQIFGEEVLSSAQIIHVTASENTRALRLAKRAQPPRIAIVGQDILVQPSDNHQLPSTAAESLYRADDVARLRMLKEFDGRVYQIDNEIEDPRFSRIDEKLDAFIERIVRPYQSPRLVLAAVGQPT